MPVAIALLVTTAVLAAPAAADAAKYRGKTTGGQKITFVKKGKRISRVRSAIFVICLRSNASETDAGLELFHPPGKFRLGKEGKTRAREESAVRGGEQAFNYVFLAKRKSSTKVAGKLRLWYWESVYDYFSNTIYFWNCSGSTKFKAKA